MKSSMIFVAAKNMRKLVVLLGFIACSSVEISNGGALPASLRRTHTDHYVEVTCFTTAGTMQIEIYPHWSPLGAFRFIHLVESGMFDNTSFWRAVPRFVVQFGIPDTKLKRTAVNRLALLEDEPNIGIQFTDGTISFAGSGKNSRLNQVFFSLGHQPRLGHSPWETAFGRITRGEGLKTLHNINTKYGDMPQFHGHGPNPNKIGNLGYSYLKENFPNLDYINTCHRNAECRKREDGWAVCDCENGFQGVHCHTPPSKEERVKIALAKANKLQKGDQ